MDEAQTSHPFYWAAFVIIGDAAKPVAALPAIKTVQNGMPQWAAHLR